MDALDRATVAKLRECAAALEEAAGSAIAIGTLLYAERYLKLATRAENLADDIEKAEAGK